MSEKWNCQHPLDHRKSKRIPEDIYFCFIDYAKGFVWITTNCGKFWKSWEYQSTWSSWETCMQVKKKQSELDMEQLIGSKLGKEYIKAIYCHLAYLTTMQGTSCKMLGWMNHRLESGLSGEISPPQICRWYHSNGRNWRGTKESLDEGERGVKKLA